MPTLQGTVRGVIDLGISMVELVASMAELSALAYLGSMAELNASIELGYSSWADGTIATVARSDPAGKTNSNLDFGLGENVAPFDPYFHSKVMASRRRLRLKRITT